MEIAATGSSFVDLIRNMGMVTFLVCFLSLYFFCQRTKETTGKSNSEYFYTDIESIEICVKRYR